VITKRNGNTVTYYSDDMERVLFEVTLPEGGFTLAELELFIEHLKREEAKREVGPS
jgi:hypothetical protein